ncbi:ABC transporter ATP-binding protein [Staphylococcus pseudintermedius]|uniref:ABC transporter ATP-binding protein n=1 Tax=Staphylococcus pseudintermedius TaxID=283734 RepID=UPI0007AEBD77|nr:ABC transporter ATP-binding protein [Staphylococcus pseudintermedius]EGQ2687092.1 ABC transporter ATP-binding protein [Staphylococcus pseudintermedius]EGQ3788995.1 ABC transporter ATP-binding protein [Staphylococcus pseudintermedius]EGQ4375550.1 ABC transporter ATP-binding protein [Staphylococcus pseudintermedius]EHC9924239.1 ABC transporter ATP-binding protein [Staphylococcus pseudintermedius]EHS7162741.1 ABC transporter ATP-binding protein [Staphylococcus pseudintermedius]
MIEIKMLHHYFGEHHVIQDFNLTIPKGKIVSFIGKSGCGKSTLLNIIGGFLTPTSGDVVIDQTRKTAPSSDCLMLFQHHNLLPWKTINDNIKLGLTKDVSNAEINTYLSTVGLAHQGTQFPAALSGGMQQRVAICRALIHQPRVVLLDEPLGALDAFTRYKLQDELIKLRTHTDATLILVTHDIDEALYLSDEIVLLGDGAQILNQYTIQQSHPRNRSDEALLSIRRQIMEDFALNHHMAEPEYYL